MKKLLKHMKLIHLIFLILGGAVVLSALPFKTQYNTIYVKVDSNGIENASREMTNAINQDQTLLYDYYELIGDNFDNHKEVVYNFQQNLNTVNNVILAFGMVIIVAALVLFLFQNHKRKIYYGTNVVMSVLATLATVGFGVVVIIQLLGAMGTLGSNMELFNSVAVLQNSDMRTAVYQAAEQAGAAGAKNALANYFYVTSTTLVMYMIGVIVTIVYALFILILTFAKFKRTKERRQENLSKAVENND
jgi:beta-lactamase regulating signal transducer with metallopeptidase domain